MDIWVINLDRRQDRLEHMQQQLRQHHWKRFAAIDGQTLTPESVSADDWAIDRAWIDPLLKRPLTYGEVGCAMSHWLIWQEIANSQRPALILEDDVLIDTPDHSLDLSLYRRLLTIVDLVYLGYREMAQAEVKPISDTLQTPAYPYHTSGYALSPHGARLLLAGPLRQQLIPVDEYLPLMIGYTYQGCTFATAHMRSLAHQYAPYHKLSALAFRKPHVVQQTRSTWGTDVEQTALVAAPFVVLTVASDPARASRLISSATHWGYDITNLGEGVHWRGGDMSGPGGGQKINLVKVKLEQIADDAIVLFVDGYDVVLHSSPQSIVDRFVEFDCDVLVAAEKQCWPDPSMAEFFPPVHTDYRYPNSGLYVGFAHKLRLLFAAEINDADDDQLYLQRQIARANELDVRVSLDHENYVFQCLSAAADDVVQSATSQRLSNRATYCSPCILHGNGGPRDKAAFDDWCQRLGYH